MVGKMQDVREEILRYTRGEQATAAVIVDDEGIIAGTTAAKKEADNLGLSLEKTLNEGSHVTKGDEVIRFSGTPKQIVMAEETLIGILAKPSGIATSASRFVKATGGRPRVVCGAWKKMPPCLKDDIRAAVVVGGAFYRMVPESFIYLDKNYLSLLGGIKAGLAAVSHLNGHAKVVQVKGRYADVASEACEAAKHGATVVFIDTGRPDDVKLVAEVLIRRGLRSRVEIGFAGGVTMETVSELRGLDIDILDIGRGIIDAPLLDMRLEIVDI
jgi:nicotinate-nucleotide pyrophosphorylase (carboxylating)